MSKQLLLFNEKDIKPKIKPLRNTIPTQFNLSFYGRINKHDKIIEVGEYSGSNSQIVWSLQEPGESATWVVRDNFGEYIKFEFIYTISEGEITYKVAFLDTTNNPYWHCYPCTCQDGYLNIIIQTNCYWLEYYCEEGYNTERSKSKHYTTVNPYYCKLTDSLPPYNLKMSGNIERNLQLYKNKISC